MDPGAVQEHATAGEAQAQHPRPALQGARETGRDAPEPDITFK